VSFTIDGPGGDAINAVLATLKAQVQARADAILTDIGEGVVTVVSKAYEAIIYSGLAGGVFGNPKWQGKQLAQSVQYERSPNKLVVFTNKKEAAYVEFGTGIFATVGPKSPITPKRAKRLAFPVWQLPTDFKGVFIPRADVKGNLAFGAIGLVLARKVQGMRPRPVWENPAVEKAILQVIEQAVKAE
jgi:hypothetical protein